MTQSLGNTQEASEHYSAAGCCEVLQSVRRGLKLLVVGVKEAFPVDGLGEAAIGGGGASVVMD